MRWFFGVRVDDSVSSTSGLATVMLNGSTNALSSPLPSGMYSVNSVRCGSPSGRAISSTWSGEEEEREEEEREEEEREERGEGDWEEDAFGS